MITLNPDELGPSNCYKFLIGSIVPRPIAWVSTVNTQGVGNLAPFSFFNGVSSNPPAVMIAITRLPDGGKKDTLRNIEETRQFVVNMVPEWLAEKMNHCSANYPYGVDEMEKAGLTPLPSVRVRPPRVQDSPIHLECELYDTLEVGDGSPGSSTIVVGRVVMMHILESAYLGGGKVQLSAIQPLARLAGASYGKVSGVFDLPRPKV